MSQLDEMNTALKAVDLTWCGSCVCFGDADKQIPSITLQCYVNEANSKGQTFAAFAQELAAKR